MSSCYLMTITIMRAMGAIHTVDETVNGQLINS